jgi:hypothetical protein
MAKEEVAEGGGRTPRSMDHTKTQRTRSFWEMDRTLTFSENCTVCRHLAGPVHCDEKYLRD